MNRHGDTMFNELHLRRFVTELNALPEREKNSAVQTLITAAEFAIASFGYLHFVGEPTRA
ncbi:hypothetical protein OG302_00985 [Streptomyces sp. NBC_01283]|uniref:hypothetical protein n=1 Tax=Streptomyces sp. NBC_01283 TaxID=2903812 RepID=UPI00352FD24B|nr:hypothetical protein OG302_00985 [Streptomyces sp. NBC_01283]